MKSGKSGKEKTDENEQLNHERIRTLAEKEEKQQILRILEADIIEQLEKKLLRKRYVRSTRKLLETKLCKNK